MSTQPCRCGFPQQSNANYCSNCGGTLAERFVTDEGSPFEPQPAPCRTEPLVLDGSPWARFSARALDLHIMAWCLYLPLAFLSLSGGGTLGQILRAIFIVGAWVPVEAYLLGRSGRTPGKRLLGLQVTRLDGSPPEMSQAAARSISVWVRGLALGLPIVSLLTAADGYSRLTRSGRTSWDMSLGLKVTQREDDVPRMAICWGLIFASIVLRYGLNHYAGFGRN